MTEKDMADLLASQEDQIRELRAALKAIHTATRDDAHEEWWTLRKWLDQRDIMQEDISGGERLIGIVAETALNGIGKRRKVKA